MRCQRCQFENMPGESRCFRCGSALDGAAIAVDIHPPRMARWKGPIRSISRWIRLHSLLPEAVANPKVPAYFKIMSGNAFAGILLSIIPGFAHLLNDRFREVVLWVTAWVIIFIAGIFFYGSGTGLLFIGFAIGIHSWIVFTHALIKEHTEAKEKFTDFIMLLVFFGLFYFGVRMTAFRNFVFGFSNLAVPYQNIQQGDMLLAFRSRANPEYVKQGAFVTTNLREFGERIFFRTEGKMAVQIVAVGGETVGVNNGIFVVNGRPLDKEHFPVPRWLQGQKLCISVPQGSYFINAEYNIWGHVPPNEAMLRNACVVAGSRIEATAVMRWLPVSKRGFLKAED